jgi:F-type H+-transporting ATPase subunit beta
LSQNFFVAEQFTGTPGQYIKKDDTVRSFAQILAGEVDHIDEGHFAYAGSIEEVIERHQKSQK